MSGAYVATVIDELKHVLSAGSETTAWKFHGATAQNNSRPQCVLQQLHTTRNRQGENSVHFYLITVVSCKNALHL